MAQTFGEGHGQYGTLVSVPDPSALARGIEKQLDDPISPKVLRARAQAFSVEASTDAYLALIQLLK